MLKEMLGKTAAVQGRMNGNTTLSGVLKAYATKGSREKPGATKLDLFILFAVAKIKDILPRIQEDTIKAMANMSDRSS
jgi:hypothetical protein